MKNTAEFLLITCVYSSYWLNHCKATNTQRESPSCCELQNNFEIQHNARKMLKKLRENPQIGVGIALRAMCFILKAAKIFKTFKTSTSWSIPYNEHPRPRKQKVLQSTLQFQALFSYITFLDLQFGKSPHDWTKRKASKAKL